MSTPKNVKPDSMTPELIDITRPLLVRRPRPSLLSHLGRLLNRVLILTTRIELTRRHLRWILLRLPDGTTVHGGLVRSHLRK